MPDERPTPCVGEDDEEEDSLDPTGEEGEERVGCAGRVNHLAC
jgi:hypothetical protein